MEFYVSVRNIAIFSVDGNGGHHVKQNKCGANKTVSRAFALHKKAIPGLILCSQYHPLKLPGVISDSQVRNNLLALLCGPSPKKLLEKIKKCMMVSLLVVIYSYKRFGTTLQLTYKTNYQVVGE